MSKKKKVGIIIAVIVVVLALLFVAFSWFLGSQIVASSTQLVTNEKTRDIHETVWEAYNFDAEAFRQTYTIEAVNLSSSFDAHTIPADFISSDEQSRDVVIMAHGLGGNRYTLYPIAQLFLENGYNVIVYDQRSSGENTAEKTTFGYWEKYDILDCIAYAKEKCPGKKLGLWGESFGGATALQAAAHENTQDDLSFLVLDCPVSSMQWMVGEEVKNLNIGIPVEYMMQCGNLVNRMEFGFSYEDVEGAGLAQKIHIPTLVMNSEADQLTPYFMGKDIYDHLAGEQKQLWSVADSKHAEIWVHYEEQYYSTVLEFIRKAG